MDSDILKSLLTGMDKQFTTNLRKQQEIAEKTLKRKREFESKCSTATELSQPQSAPKKQKSKDPVEALATARKELRIKVQGQGVPKLMQAFSELYEFMPRGGKAARGICQRVQQCLANEGYTEPTPIQQQAIPCLMNRRELLAIAPTGSGKTLAFLIPAVLFSLLRNRAIKKAALQVRAELDSTGHHEPGARDQKLSKLTCVIVSPTKELNAQSVRVLSRVFAGVGVRGMALTPGAIAGADMSLVNILLTTPLTLAATLEPPSGGVSAGTTRKALTNPEPTPKHEHSKSKKSKNTSISSKLGNKQKQARDQQGDTGSDDEDSALGHRKVKGARASPVLLSHVSLLVLDECDTLLGASQLPQVDAIIAACNHVRVVRALFSATLPDTVEQLARTALRDPLRITVGLRNSAVHNVTQELLYVGFGEAGRQVALERLLGAGGGGLTPPVLVFVKSKARAAAVHRSLLPLSVRVDSLHADQSPAIRDAALDNFRYGRTWVLITTDLLARGIDFVRVELIINYDLPRTPLDYVHRIGRTGRAGAPGRAVTLFGDRDIGRLRAIASVVKEAGGTLPAWVLNLPKSSEKRDKRKRIKRYEQQNARQNL